jgi:hypothetical protein
MGSDWPVKWVIQELSKERPYNLGLPDVMNRVESRSLVLLRSMSAIWFDG